MRTTPLTKQELILKEQIRRAIRITKLRKMQESYSNDDLSSLISRLVKVEKRILEGSQPDRTKPVSNSTGINVLSRLLGDIINTLKEGYVSLTTSPEERKSFRAHIINAIEKTLVNVKTNKSADDDKEQQELDEIEVKVGDGEDTPDEDKFIDIRSDKEKEEEEQVDPKEEFGIPNLSSPEHLQGRNKAFEYFNLIETKIVDAYSGLEIAEDQELFYDYLIANIKLYFDMFEQEIGGVSTEPTNQAYKDAKATDQSSPDEETPEGPEEPQLDLGNEEGAEEEPAPEGEGEEEPELQLESSARRVKLKKVLELRKLVNQYAKEPKNKKLLEKINALSNLLEIKIDRK